MTSFTSNPRMNVRRLVRAMLRPVQWSMDSYFNTRHPRRLAQLLIRAAAPAVRRMVPNDKWSLGVHAPFWMAVVRKPGPKCNSPKRIFLVACYRGQFTMDITLAALLAWRGHHVTIGYLPKLTSPVRPPFEDDPSAAPYVRNALSRVSAASGGRVVAVDLTAHATSEWPLDREALERQATADAVMCLLKEDIRASDPDDAAALARLTRLGENAQRCIAGFLVPRRAEFDIVLAANGSTFESAQLRDVAGKLDLPFNSFEKFAFRHVRLMTHGGPIFSFGDLRSLWDRREELGYTAPPIRQFAVTKAEQLLNERRSAATTSWAWKYQTAPGQTTEAALQASGVGANEAYALVLPNVPFDAGYFEFTRVFPSMRDWLVTCVRELLATSKIRVVVRGHPGEALYYRRTTQTAHGILEKAGLAGHPRLTIIPGAEKVNTFGLMEKCKFGTVFSSTTGLEMAMLGKPVVVAADVYYGRAGFTLDAEDSQDYLSRLRNLANDEGEGSLRADQIADARLFYYLLHYVMQWPYPYDKPADVRNLPMLDLIGSDEVGRFIPTLDALVASKSEYEKTTPDLLGAASCRHLSLPKEEQLLRRRDLERNSA